MALSRNRAKNSLTLVEQANEELERLARMKAHFLGMISHEFRTPLTGIIGSADFLITHYGVAANDETRQLLEVIKYGGDRLNQVVNNLLKVVCLEGSVSTLKKRPLHLWYILESTINRFMPYMVERQQRIVCGDLTELLYFNGDREYFEEVFTELLENASKFTPDGGDINVAAKKLLIVGCWWIRRQLSDVSIAGFMNLWGIKSIF